MKESSQLFRPVDRPRLGRALGWAMGTLLVLHLIELLLLGQHRIEASRFLTAALAAVASLCVFHRARLVSWAERTMWLWGGAGMFLWAAAHAVETVIGHSAAASVLTVDASDYIYLTALFPLLLAFATTHETQNLRWIFILNCAQIALAMVLAYFLLYRMSLTPALAETVMGRIYGVACGLLAVMSVMRGLCWINQEERQCVHWISIFLWTYLPIELAMDYATQYRGLKAGTVLDLAWSVPFAVSGWKALTLPVFWSTGQPSRRRGKRRMLVEALCPLLMNSGIFVLAAAVIRQHTVIALISIFALIIIQGAQAALIQMSFMAGRNQLLDREVELRNANAALEELTQQDPLTGIANRRRFDAALETSWRRAVRKRVPISVLMVDIDFFKGVNDLHGHSYGDECLVTLARMMSQLGRRPDDLVARMGGEEFVLLLPDTDESGAAGMAERLHESIRNLAIVTDASPFGNRLTVSIGIASCVPVPGSEATTFVEAADRALYEAKKKGRNCTSSSAVS